MIRVSTPVRSGSALLAMAGAVALAGCTATAPDAPASNGSDMAGATYADGTYSAEGSYQTPESVETVDVSLTLEGGVVSAVTVTGDPQRPESQLYQGEFIAGISEEVVGKALDELNVTRVAGSSLTSGGFNQALDQIKRDAAA